MSIHPLEPNAPLLFPSAASAFASSDCLFRSGLSRTHLASSPLVLFGSNLVFRGNPHKFFSCDVMVLKACSIGCWGSFRYFCRKFPLLRLGPPLRVLLISWVLWFPQPPPKSKPVRVSFPSFRYHRQTRLTRFLNFVAGGENLRTTIQGSNGPKDVPNYALIQGIFIGCVAVYVIFLTVVGPENHGSHFERGKAAFQAGASREDVGSIPTEAGRAREAEKLSVESDRNEKGDVDHHHAPSVRAAPDQPRSFLLH